ncbi:MAG: hypothetical protein JXB23_17135, partial [Candidatus Aminicenantes bacterium]|nr:hypothetical protein [Candidatus Aminicenantes bacterium]
MIKKIFPFVFPFLFFFPLILPAQTSPEEFLGHKVGADRKLADYNQIRTYFEKLDSESEKIRVLTLGKTTMGKSLIMAVITSEENMARLETYRQNAKALRDARDLTTDEARKLSREGKITVMITCSLHSDEIGASQMSMELAHRLVTGQAPIDVDRILKDVIVLLVPTSNPDGHQMVTEWYKKYVGTKYEGGQMPWLYHHYAGHDNNRDWFMLNLAETKEITKVLYHEWIPQIHIDEHQTGETDARLFVPPFMDPPNPNVHPLLWQGVGLCGMNMAYDLQKNDFEGVVYGREYTGWWDGACDNTGWLHNTICLLSEMASVNLASPIYIDPTEIPKVNIEKRMQLPDPWTGGWWKLRDIVDYDLSLSLSLIKTASLHKEDFLYNFYKMCRDSIEKTEEGSPFAFVIPQNQHDYPTTLKMLDVLISGGAEIHKATEDFIADEKVFPADSFVVLLSQPYRPYVQNLLEIQKYPDMRLYPGGPPIPPYDTAGWTLPLQMGVQCVQIQKSFNADLTKLEKVPDQTVTPPQKTAPCIVLDSRLNNSYSVIFPLLKESVEIYRSKDVIQKNGLDMEAGSFLIKNTPHAHNILPDLLEKWHVNAYEIKNFEGIPKTRLKKHRVGLYKSWRSNMDEGWTRYVFDDLGIPFNTLYNKDFKEKREVNLNSRFDVLVFADENSDIIKAGKPSRNSPYGRYDTDYPPEYQGGIGKEGIEALKTFVEQGGIIVTLNRACGLIFREFDVPAEN